MVGSQRKDEPPSWQGLEKPMSFGDFITLVIGFSHFVGLEARLPSKTRRIGP
jgi:hypothetical protein